MRTQDIKESTLQFRAALKNTVLDFGQDHCEKLLEPFQPSAKTLAVRPIFAQSVNLDQLKQAEWRSSNDPETLNVLESLYGRWKDRALLVTPDISAFTNQNRVKDGQQYTLRLVEKTLHPSLNVRRTEAIATRLLRLVQLTTVVLKLEDGRYYLEMLFPDKPLLPGIAQGTRKRCEYSNNLLNGCYQEGDVVSARELVLLAKPRFIVVSNRSPNSGEMSVSGIGA